MLCLEFLENLSQSLAKFFGEPLGYIEAHVPKYASSCRASNFLKILAKVDWLRYTL